MATTEHKADDGTVYPTLEQAQEHDAIEARVNDFGRTREKFTAGQRILVREFIRHELDKEKPAV